MYTVTVRGFVACTPVRTLSGIACVTSCQKMPMYASEWVQISAKMHRVCAVGRVKRNIALSCGLARALVCQAVCVIAAGGKW